MKKSRARRRPPTKAQLMEMCEKLDRQQAILEGQIALQEESIAQQKKDLAEEMKRSGAGEGWKMP
jgi:hypothetical protein